MKFLEEDTQGLLTEAITPFCPEMTDPFEKHRQDEESQQPGFIPPPPLVKLKSRGCRSQMNEKDLKLV